MATGGLRVLFTLPIVLALLVAGLLWLTPLDGYGDWVITQPDQVVRQFIEEINSGRMSVARQQLDPTLRGIDLDTLSERLDQFYGPPVVTTTEINQWNADSAVVWTTTRTAKNHQYFINWTLNRVGNRWVITDLGSLRYMFSDVKGLK